MDDDEKESIAAEERAEMRILASHMKTIIFYYQKIEERLKEQNETLEKLEEKLGIIIRR